MLLNHDAGNKWSRAFSAAGFEGMDACTPLKIWYHCMNLLYKGYITSLPTNTSLESLLKASERFHSPAPVTRLQRPEAVHQQRRELGDPRKQGLSELLAGRVLEPLDVDMTQCLNV